MAILVRLDVLLALRKIRSSELADQIGLAEADLALLGSGRAKGVRLETLDAICDRLDCQPGDLFEFVRDEAAKGGRQDD